MSNGQEAVLEIRPDSTVLNVLSLGAFGYSPQEMMGQRLSAIAHGSERAQFVHALQVLLRMGELSKMMGATAGMKAQSVRCLHHIIVRSVAQPRRAS